MTSAQIKIIDNISQSILASFDIDESDAAYKFASEMEEMGLDIKISSPSIAETLGETLGVNEAEMDEFKESMEAEISSHLDRSDSCCFKAD